MKPKSTKRSWSDDIDLFINQFFLTLTIGQGPQLRTIAVYVHEEVYQIWLKWVCELAVFQTSSLPLLNWPRRFPKKHLYALEKNKFIRKFSSPRACIFTCNLFFTVLKRVDKAGLRFYLYLFPFLMANIFILKVFTTVLQTAKKKKKEKERKSFVGEFVIIIFYSDYFFSGVQDSGILVFSSNCCYRPRQKPQN